MTCWLDSPASRAVHTACASLRAAAEVGGVMPSDSSCARNASSVLLALAVPAKPSAVRLRAAAVRAVPATVAVKRRVNIEVLLITDVMWFTLGALKTESAWG